VPHQDAQREDAQARLANVIRWLRIAKENFPAISDGQVSADRVALASGLFDRIQMAAVKLQDKLAQSKAVADKATDRAASKPADKTAPDRMHQAA
jgi:hypothetical protein